MVGQAFRELTGPHWGELQLHCYWILGSVHDAEDMLQETLLAARRGLGQFEERASVRSWLYKIATNRCLNALREAVALALVAGLQRLPPRQRAVLVLRDVASRTHSRPPTPAAWWPCSSRTRG